GVLEGAGVPLRVQQRPPQLVIGWHELHARVLGTLVHPAQLGHLVGGRELQAHGDSAQRRLGAGGGRRGPGAAAWSTGHGPDSLAAPRRRRVERRLTLLGLTGSMRVTGVMEPTGLTPWPQSSPA